METDKVNGMDKSFVGYWEKRTNEIQQNILTECYTERSKVFDALVNVYLSKVIKSVDALLKHNIEKVYNKLRENNFEEKGFWGNHVFWSRDEIVCTLCNCFESELKAEFSKDTDDNLGAVYNVHWERAHAFNERLQKLAFDVKNKFDDLVKDCLDGLMLSANSDTLRAKAWGVFLNNLNIAKDEYQKELATLSEEIHVWKCEGFTNKQSN